MRTLEEIMQDTEEKARLLAAQDSPEVDEVLQKVIAQYLKEPKKKKSRPKPKASNQEKKPRKPRKPLPRLTLDVVLEVYEKTGLKPFKTEYWFYENRKSCPLIQASTLSDDRTQATPMAAYCLMKRDELLASDNPPTFITNYRDLDKPSNKWTAGRLTQISGLDMSYLLGYQSAYAGNGPGHPNCSERYHLGYQDGLSVRNSMIEKEMIEPDPSEDIYADEADEGVLNELHRVTGYWRKEWDEI